MDRMIAVDPEPGEILVPDELLLLSSQDDGVIYYSYTSVVI